MEQEEIFVVSQKYIGGGWNKLAKSQELFWWSESQAKNWLEDQPDWFRQANAVFKLLINIEKVEKV